MKKIFTILCAVGLIATAKAQTPLNNGGFETWSNSLPASWGTYDGVLVSIGQPNPGTANQETTVALVKELASSIRLEPKAIAALGGKIAPGYATYGVMAVVGGSSIARYGTAFTSRPDSISFWINYVPSGGDTAVLTFSLTKNTALVGGIGASVNSATILPTSTGGWVKATIPFIYQNANIPDTLSISFSTGYIQNTLGTKLYVDDVKLIYNTPPPPPTATVTPAGPINLCTGGSQVLTASTGAGYSYQWSNTGGPISGATSGTFTATATGTYSVKVTSTGGTASSTGVVVTVNPNPTVTVSVTQSNCATPTGTATANASGGTGVLTYAWSPAGSGASLTAKPAGTYTVTVTDTKSCKATASNTITNPNAPTASLGSSTPPTCSYSTNGQATITASGGSGSGYTYTWSAGANTATRNDLAGGTAYTVTVKDGLSCAATATVNVNLTAPAALAPTQSNVNAVKCKGGNNGTATLSTTGGTPNYTYNWGGGTTGAAQTALTAKTYQVTVTDSKSCTATTSVVIGEPAAALSATTSKTNTTATALPVGGTSPYTYTWSTSPAQNTATATGLAKGTYTVTVKDANLCNTTATVTVLGPNSIETISAGITTLNVYPNPSNGVFNLEVSLKDASDLTISISDIAGRKAFETTEKNVTDLTKQISLNNLSKGIYVVNIKTATGSANQRIVIE
jgi:hypothetical protein